LSSQGTGHPSPLRVAQRAAAIFFAGGLVAYLCAPAAESPPSAELSPLRPVATAKDDGSLSPSVQVQQLLAQSGCPGWMTLASDRELQATIDGQGVRVYEGPLQQTAAFEDPDAPRVQYPAPLRVAAAQQVGDPAIDLPTDDELISESEDLLLTSPEVVGSSEAPPAAKPPAEAETPPEADEPPAGDPQEPASPEVGGPVELPPVDADATPVPSSPPVGNPDEELIPPNEDLVLPEAGAEGDAPRVETPAEPEPLPPAQPPVDELLDDRDDLLEPEAPPQTQPPAAAPGAQTPPGPMPPGPASGPAAAPAAAAGTAGKKDGEESHCEFIAKQLYPSAKECRACHEKIYDQWSISSHAYAFTSPMFHKFEQKINDVASGTIGYFCYRCHTPAGTSLGISRGAPYWEAPQVAREGVTCVACHRVREAYGKTNGERRIEPGDIFAPVYGSIGGDGVAIAASQKDKYKVHTAPGEKTPGIDMHAVGFCAPQLSRSEFCASCHQVAVYPGIKLEVVWEQYRASPACKKGITCQECHMGRIPGVASGYEFGPAAEINKRNVHPNRKHSNHIFYGPGYSIAHPGVFPFNPKADRWSVKDWLLFDWRAGWGTDAFEDAVDDGNIHVQFPDVWKEADDRYDARDIIDDNLKKKQLKDRLRKQVMENGSHVDGPFFEGPQRVGQELQFSYIVINKNEGHNMPTASLGAQPQLWANVVLIGPRGQRLWESGYLDSLGDLADIHSVDVRNKRMEFDWQLFNLQTMFLITGAKGTDREFYLPVNVDIDPLPFIRPAPQPVSVLNHPPFIRMEARSLAPLGSRRVPYKVPGHLLCEPGRYRLSFRMRNRTEPMYFMRFCESTVEMQQAMIEGTLDFHESSVEFDVR
jgi:hypothetical protein